MNKILCTICALLLPLVVMSQNYDAMWNEVEKANNNDLPKTALATLDKIIITANRKGDNDQLAKALIEKMYTAGTIAPDSAEALLPKVEKFCQSRKNAIDRSVYQVLLGWLYKCRSINADPQTKEKAIQAFRAATAEPNILANTRSDKYLTLLNKNDDSQYYNHDLLSVFFPFIADQLCQIRNTEADSLAEQVMAKEIEWYSAHKMREATMFAKIDSVIILNKDNAEFYQQIIKDYGDLPVSTKAYAMLCQHYNGKECYELAKEALLHHPKTVYTNTFKNIIARTEQARLRLQAANDNTYPGESLKLIYTYSNVSNATLSYYHLPYSATSPEWLALKEKDYHTLAKKADFQQELPLHKGMPYDEFKDSISLSVPDPGIYLVKVSGKDFDSRYTVIRVSRLAVMQLPLPEGKVRIGITDYKSGKPVPHSMVQLYITKNKSVSWQKHKTNERGEITLDKIDGSVNIFASTEGDNALAPVAMVRNYAYAWNRTTQSINTQIYTDRAVYRPGQQVKIGGFVYSKVNDSTSVIANMSLKLEICDVNAKVLQTITVITDKLGAFGTEFTLPQECLNGNFSIRSEHGYANFMVEEYKRPKFYVSINKPTSSYTLGDTVMVYGEVKTYSGLPLDNTTLICDIERRQSWWLRYNDNYDAPYIKRDTIKTDAKGLFELPIVLEKPKIYNDNIELLRPLNYIYTINVKATADDGETEESNLRLYAGNIKAFVNIDIPDVICKEQMPHLSATQSNSMGEPVSGMGKYLIVQDTDTIQCGTIQFNLEHQLDFIAQLPSSQYTVIVFPTDDNNKYHASQHQFTLISLNDSKPVGTQPLQVWRSSNEFDEDKPVEIVVGTPLKEAWLHYDVMANGKVFESEIIHLNDTVMRLQFDWKEEYGLGAHVLMAIFHNGELHANSFVLTKALPDKKLKLRWSSFRDKLLPGTTESWTLQVLKNGKPVEASLIATMYDASLDKFRKHDLPLFISYNRYVPQQTWDINYRGNLFVNLKSSFNLLSEKSFAFTKLRDLFYYNPFERNIYTTGQISRAAGSFSRESVPMMAMAKSNEFASMAMNDAAMAEGAVEETVEEQETDLIADINLRSDFSETAFFSSTLRTDANGEARIEFKLPESLTSWNFKALAHTYDLNYGLLDTLIVVQKPFMVQANMPRFLRNGDKTHLAVTIRNNSDKIQSGKAQLALIDAQSGEQLELLSLPFNVEANQNATLDFPIEANDKQSMLICRYAAISDEFNDGEQQYIPILSDLQKTINTVSYTINDGRAQTISLDSLHYNPTARHSLLTIEYTGNPAWAIISALPSTVDYQSRCATQLAINYSALTMMRQIISNNPQLRETINSWRHNDSVPSIFAQLQNNPELKIAAIEQTPWVRSAEREQNRLEALILDDQAFTLKQTSMLHKLREMQTSDGGWQWFPNMPTNTNLTLDIVEMLSRTRVLCPSAAADITPMLTAAMRYLDDEATKAVNNLKKNKTKTVPTLLMHYLYVVAINNGNLNSEICKYLINQLQKSSNNYNLYDKAMAAVVLQKAKLTKQAELTLQSLMEHTVSRPEMGRYFDSNRATSNYSMYKIPTQIATIEACKLIRPQDRQTIDELSLWLLHSKHTQVWDEPLAATQAISSLLTANTLAAPTSLPARFDLNLANNRTMPIQDYADIDPFVQFGYVKATFGEQEMTAAPVSLTVQPSAATIEQPLSYGAAYLQSWQPALETPTASTELAISWQLYKEASGKWQPVNKKDKLRIGDRVKVRYDITAARDLDFVVLHDGRPACLEPTSTASGYNWNNGSYRSVGDNGTSWYFDHFSKGHHIIEDTYDVDRTGSFSSACPQVQCLYAPEFTARARAITISAE